MEYHKLQLDVAELEKKMMSEIIRPERILLYLVPGRLVCFFIYFFSILV
jgi:ATP-dependent RNA helicase DOB1